MKKLSDYIGQKIAIHFPTYELWLRRKEINPSDTCLDFLFNTVENFCYYPFGDNFRGTYSNQEKAIKDGYTILPATDFLEEEFVYGQEYEFSDDEDFKKYYTQRFGCLYPENSEHSYKYLSFDKVGRFYGWKYCRKINTERNEAITTAKELITKFDIKQDEIY